MSEENKKVPRVVFEFGEEGIKHELFEVNGKQMLTAAAIMLVQVAAVEEDGDVDKVKQIFLEDFLPEVVAQMKVEITHLGKDLEKQFDEVLAGATEEELREIIGKTLTDVEEIIIDTIEAAYKVEPNEDRS